MRFQLLRGPCPGHGKVVSTADDPHELDFTTLQHCDDWSIWVTCDDGVPCRVAYVIWLPCAGYRVHNEFDKLETLVRNHALLVPIVRGVVWYNWIFGSYRKYTTAYPIHVYPYGD